MPTVPRVLVTAVAALSVASLPAYLAVEAYIVGYTRVLRLPSREALADDYGAAFDALIIAVVVFAITLVASALLSWRLLGRKWERRDG